MPLTRNFKATIKARADRDPKFRAALYAEALDALVEGDTVTAKAMLRDYVNATIGFERLEAVTGTSRKSLMRMLSYKGQSHAGQARPGPEGDQRGNQAEAGSAGRVRIARGASTGIACPSTGYGDRYADGAAQLGSGSFTRWWVRGMSQFAFLKADFPEVHANAERAEKLVKGDPRGASFYARLALETAVKWMYRHDGELGDPYQDTLSAMVHHSSFRTVAGEALVAKARVVIKRGNFAAHDSRAISETDAISAVRELFHFTYWLQRTYGRSVPDDGLQFSVDALPQLAEVKASTLDQLTTLAKKYREQSEKLEAAEAARLKDEEARAKLEAELAELRALVAKRKAENATVTDRHDYNEAATRDALIDVLLREAGWALDRPEDIEFEVDGMPKREPTSTGKGYVDYVLWGDDGKPLGLVEAKRTKRDPREGQHQAKLYADCLEARYGQRPVIFYSNGYDHWMWDDETHPPREVQGFYKKDELALLIQRRNRAKSPATLDIDTDIAGRSYQMRAIRRVCESFEVEGRRRALARHGDRHRQDAHDDCADRSSDARQLGAACAVPGGPPCAGETSL